MVAVLLPAPAFSQEAEDSQLFISGFNAYQKQDYSSAIESMSVLLKKYPDTTMKDMALFWLARAHYKAGNEQEAGKYMAQFFQQYPKSPLKGSVEDGLVALAEKYKKGEPLPAAPKAAIVAHALAAEPVNSENVVPEASANAAAPRTVEPKVITKRQEAAEVESTNVTREKAIAAYKDVIDKFPGTAAASSASAKLHRLGIEYPAAAKGSAPAAKQEEVSQVFNVEVTQFADFKMQAPSAPMTADVGRTFIVPVDIVNTGNGRDSFTLESGFPAEYNFHFAAASAPEVPITATAPLAVGEKFQAIGVGIVPRSNYDGQKNSYPVKVVSSVASDVSQSREVALVSAAPLLRAVVKSDKAKLLPGDKVTYRISLLNIGTAAARSVAVAINYPPQYEPAGVPSGAKQQTKGAILLDGLQLKSGESKEFTCNFTLKDEALAGQELLVRADVTNTELDKKESFVSATSVVQRVSGVTAKTTAGKMTVIPGQVVSIPIMVTNTGNVRELFAIKANVTGSSTYTFYDDLNRDGKRQPNEPIINHAGPLSPKEEAYLLLEIATPAAANDGGVAPVSVHFEPENAADRSAAVNLQLTYSRPILELALAGRGGRLKPGEVSSLEMDCTNRGSNLAKQVVLQSVLPAQLELVASEPSFWKGENGTYFWRFDELGAGEKRSIKVTYKVRPGIAVGTSMQLKNLLSYEDQIGNRY